MSREKQLDSSRMGTEHEGRLLLSLAVPMMLSMLVQALYNVVDSIYVSWMSENCLSALSLAFPAQNIMIGLGTGTGVGVSTLAARALGRGDREGAGRVAGNAVTLSLCCWALMAVFGLFAAKPFIYSQTADAEIRAFGDSYLQIVTIGSVFLYLEICVERLLQSTGLSKLSMWTQMAGAVTNIVLDPVFIFGWLGLPAMGTAGAAVATVIGQAVGASLGFFFHFKYNHELPISLRGMKLSGRLVGEIYRIGFPSILMMGIGSVTNYLMNRILIAFTSTAIAVYGGYFKLQSFFFMPVFGMNNAMIPVIGYNFGARHPQRIHRTIRFGVLYAECFMLLGFLAFQLLPQQLLGVFHPSAEMLAIGTAALRRISWSFLLAGFCIIAGSACQALDRPGASFMVSVLRQLVVLIPAAWLLSRTGDVNAIWWAFPIAELMSLAASAVFLRGAMRNMEKTLALRAMDEDG